MDKFLKMLAEENYQSMKTALDSMKWKYTTFSKKLAVKYSVKGNDLPMEFVMKIDGENQLITVMSRLPIEVCEDKRVDVSLAVNHVNYKIADGNFDFDMTTGLVYYKVSASYQGSLIGDKLIEYLVNVSANTVDRYNDKFDAIVKDELSIDAFLE